jgi:hypothetical protein
MGLLSLIPHLNRAGGRWLVAVCGCGWVEHCAACSDSFSPCGGGGLGTLLGPEETPALRGVGFLGAIPGLAGLTHGEFFFVWWWVWGSGCGCVLSVA